MSMRNNPTSESASADPHHVTDQLRKEMKEEISNAKDELRRESLECMERTIKDFMINQDNVVTNLKEDVHIIKEQLQMIKTVLHKNSSNSEARFSPQIDQSCPSSIVDVPMHENSNSVELRNRSSFRGRIICYFKMTLWSKSFA